jgi:RNA polymerase sigma-70 factor (ECF subfamily)
LSENPANPAAQPLRSADGETNRRAARDRAAGDGLLLTRAKGGDQQAMTELFDQYSGMVYSVALRVLKDPGQAEDIMQEIFFQVWRNPDAFVSGRGSLGAWLAVMARNRAIDSLRKRRPTDSVDDVVLASNSDLGSEVERNRMMEKVRGVLKDLPVEQQTSVEMAFFEGLTHSEIAAKTGDPLGTVKTRIRSALITLRKAITA